MGKYFFRDVRLSLLVDKYWTPLEKYKAISEVTFDMMKDFSEKLLKRFYIQGLIQGNVDKEMAIRTTKMFIDILKYEPISNKNISKVYKFFNHYYS